MLNTNQNDISDLIKDNVVVVSASSGSTVTVPANSSLDVSNYVDNPSVPSGYKNIMNIASAEGSPWVISCGWGSWYVLNVSSSARSVTLYRRRLCARDL